jgi:hypoxanthine phosphoribosyltransferase
VRILKDLDAPIEGKDVLIVEDIVDSGLTLNYLLRNLRGRNPRSLEVCALLVKPGRRKIDLPIRYVGFEIPNQFVVGYGLDLDQRYRNLPYVAAVEDSEIERLERPRRFSRFSPEGLKAGSGLPITNRD